MFVNRRLLTITLTWLSSWVILQITIKNIRNLFVQACNLATYFEADNVKKHT